MSASTIAVAFLGDAKRLREAVDRSALEAFLSRHDAQAAAAEVARAAVHAWPGLVAAMQAETLTAGRRATAEVRAALAATVEKRFDPFGERTRRVVHGWTTSLIDRLREEAARVASLVARLGLAVGRPASAIADDVMTSIGLAPNAARDADAYRAGLEGLGRNALQAALRDERTDPTVLRAIAEQVPLAAGYVAARLASYRATALRRRAAGLGDALVFQADAIATDETWGQAIADGLTAGVRKFWVHKGDHRVRPTHISIPVLHPDGVPFDGAFTTSAGNTLRYPGDPEAPIEEVANCRCSIRHEPSTTR